MSEYGSKVSFLRWLCGWPIEKALSWTPRRIYLSPSTEVYSYLMAKTALSGPVLNWSSQLSSVVLTPEGSLKRFRRNGANWEVPFKAPANLCEIYGACGPFGLCVSSVPLKCKCFKGFVPKSTDEWKKGNWTGGCGRRTELFCHGNSTGKSANGFHPVPSIKPPDFYKFVSSVDVEACRQSCLHNCSCLAFAYISGIGCLVWNQELIDIMQFSEGGELLFIRLASSELGMGLIETWNIMLTIVLKSTQFLWHCSFCSTITYLCNLLFFLYI